MKSCWFESQFGAGNCYCFAVFFVLFALGGWVCSVYICVDLSVCLLVGGGEGGGLVCFVYVTCVYLSEGVCLVFVYICVCVCVCVLSI